MTGRLMSGRVHRPLTIEKEIDRASPLLYMAIARVGRRCSPPNSSGIASTRCKGMDITSAVVN